MVPQWYSHLPKDKQADFKQYVLNSQKVLDRAAELVYNMYKDGSLSDYDSPSWAFKEADRQGFNRALKEIIKILDITNQHKGAIGPNERI